MTARHVRDAWFPNSPNPADVLRAELYVALHRGSPGDVEFYREACRGAGRVLELGCGDGRVLFELCDVIAEGAEAPALVGLDCDLGMLALAERRARQLALSDSPAAAKLPTFVLGDMREFDVEGQFDRIIVPYCGLWCLPDEDKLSCLRAILGCLAPGGELYFDVYDAEGMDEGAEDTEGPIEDDYELVATVQLEHAPSDCPEVGSAEVGSAEVGSAEVGSAEVGSARVRRVDYDVFEKNCYWFRDRVVEATFDYRARGASVAASSAVTTQVIRHHYLECAELLSLSKRAGFGRVELLEASDQEPFEGGQLYFRCALR